MNLKFECSKCGSIVDLKKEIVVDNYLKKIDIVYPRCSCGNKNPSNFKMLDLEISSSKEEN